MTAALDPGEEHSQFVEWAQDHGVDINGIAPARFMGRGMGIVAARDIKKGECLVHISNQSLIHIASPMIKDIKLPQNATVHGKLAAVLALWYTGQVSHDHQLWIDVWPSQTDFNQTMPFFYHSTLQKYLPAAAKDLLTKQCANLDRDWNELHARIPTVSKEIFTYTWLVVNTRTFYWDYPDLPNSHPRLPKRRAKLTAADCYVMCPFIDYFNHASVGCIVESDAKGYSVTADRDYKAGVEVYVSYGPHTNDFLLAEYGFLLEENSHDSVPLDEVILPLLDRDQIEALKDDGFHRDYTLSTSSPVICHRTQAALRLLVLDTRRYSAFVSGDDDGLRDQAQINQYLVGLLTKHCREILNIQDEMDHLAKDSRDVSDSRRRSSRIGETSGGPRAEHARILLRRWKQIQSIVNVAIDKLKE